MEIIEPHLNKLGYTGNFSEINLNEGEPNLDFIATVSWLSSQLVTICELESHVSPITNLDDLLGFLVEVSSLLKEIYCPYKSLTKGPITERLLLSADKKLLITYLITELEAAKIQAVKKPKKKDVPMQIELAESRTAKELREMLVCLRFSKPPESITPQQLFGEVEKKLKTLSQPSTPREKVGDLLFSGCLTEKQWFQLEYLYKEMYQEYKTRRNLLLTRLDVTVKSFLWTDRLKNKYEDVINSYNKSKSGIVIEPSVKIAHVLAARADLAVIEKTSSASVRKNTKSSVNSVVIGAVPDRGGRPEEQQPPPPEVPSWQKNESSTRGGFKSLNQHPSGNFKNSGYSRDENSNNRSHVETSYRGDNPSRGHFRGGRNDHNAQPLVYQPVNFYAQIPNQQLGFGGYMPAGDNFQQYGMPAGDNFQQYGMSNNMHQFQGRGGPRGNSNRSRGTFSDRGYNQSRGGSRGRGRN